jgi:hypothetical protein
VDGAGGIGGWRPDLLGRRRSVEEENLAAIPIVVLQRRLESVSEKSSEMGLLLNPVCSLIACP